MGHETPRSCLSAEMDKSCSSNEIYGSSVRMVYHPKLTSPQIASFGLKLIWIVVAPIHDLENENLSCLIIHFAQGSWYSPPTNGYGNKRICAYVDSRGLLM